jgi:hypothetical protein
VQAAPGALRATERFRGLKTAVTGASVAEHRRLSATPFAGALEEPAAVFHVAICWIRSRPSSTFMLPLSIVQRETNAPVAPWSRGTPSGDLKTACGAGTSRAGRGTCPTAQPLGSGLQTTVSRQRATWDRGGLPPGGS